MDSPSYTAPDPSTYPPAADYGSQASHFSGIYGTASTPGLSGPQLPGMLDPDNGNASYAMAINGFGGNNGDTANVPVGYDTSGNLVTVPEAATFMIQPDAFSATDTNVLFLYPTNRNPFSITLWFQSTPGGYDWNRFATMFGIGDTGWRCAMANGGNAAGFNGRRESVPALPARLAVAMTVSLLN